jgi:NRPS condensation-like uncharacterized protein
MASEGARAAALQSDFIITLLRACILCFVWQAATQETSSRLQNATRSTNYGILPAGKDGRIRDVPYLFKR